MVRRFYRRNPALYEINAETFTDLVLAQLPAEIRAIAEQVKDVLVPIAGELLSAERVKRRMANIDAQRTTETYKGKTRETLGEPTEMFASVEEAKAALIGMLQDLAMLPPPGSGAAKDDIGFSGATNTPLRRFLSHVEAGDDQPPLSDFLRAARLLIVHSRTQLPRARVMGVIRTLETAIPQTKPLAARPTKPPASAFDIVSAKGGSGSDDIGTTGWEWDGGPTVTVQIPAKLRYREAEASVPGAEMVREGETWRLRVPVGGIPALARWLQSQGVTTGARKLLAASERWQEAAGVSETLAGAPDPSTGMHTPGPSPADLKGGHAAPQDKRRGGLSDFDAVKWKWDGGPTVKLALSMVKQGRRWAPLTGQVEEALERQGSNVYGLAEQVPRGRYSDYYHEYDIKDVPFIAQQLRNAYRQSIAGDKLDELHKWWSSLASSQQAAPRRDESTNAVKGATPVQGGRVQWERDSDRNAVRFSFPYDRARGRGDQISQAFRERKLPHRRLGFDILVRTPQIEHMVHIMRDEGRFAKAIPALEALLPEWKELERRGTPQTTLEERLSAAQLVRRLRTSMESPNDAERLIHDIDAYAPYIHAVEPGALEADLGPYGRWKIVNERRKAKDGSTPGELRLYLGGTGVEGMAKGYAKKEQDPVKGDEWYMPFDLKRVEEIARGLDRQARQFPDKQGLSALALSLRAATLVDSARDPCPILDALASAHELDQITNEEAKRLVRETHAKAKPHLAPGIELREYQQIAMGFAKAANNRAIIGDAMGLGKTPTAIGVMLANPQDMLPALVVAPASVASSTWPYEIPKFAPNLRVAKGMAHDGMTGKEAIRSALKRADWDVLIVPWTSLRLVRKELVAAAKAGQIRGVVYDETHKAKNANAAQSKTAKEIAHAVKGGRIFLTGTLIENNVGEAWHQLHMLNPVDYSERADFQDRFGGGGGKRVVYQIDPATGETIKRTYRARDRSGMSEKEKVGQQLHELQIALRCDMVRRLKTDVLSELPPKTRTFEAIELPVDVRRTYKHAIKDISSWLCSSLRYWTATAAAKQIEKAARDGRVLSPDDAVGEVLLSRVPLQEGEPKPTFSAENMEKGAMAVLGSYRMVVFGAIRRLIGYLKAPIVAERVIEHISSSDTPAVVFVEHKAVMDILSKALDKAKLRWVKIDGSTPVNKRGQIVQDFQAGKYDVIVGSQSMTEGVTLTAADHSFFAEQWWNPAKIEQAEDRIHRADDLTLSRDAVYIHHLFVPGTVDEDVIELLEGKREVIGQVLGQEATHIEESAKTQGASKFLKGVVDKIKEENGGSVMPCVADADDVEEAIDGTLEKPEALDVGFGPEEVRKSRENPRRRRRRRNPARASRGEQYQSATLTNGHFDTATVKVATKIAEKARRQGKKLGRGNFGEVYGIGGHVVKFPVLDGFNRQKTPEQARAYLLHEAGVANELAEAGHRVVPVTVFVELPDGTPALVREYGEPLSKVTTDEVAALEEGLYDVEATGKQGWDVADELLVMRRKDGTLFVADVGWWRVRKKARKHGVYDSSEVPSLLSRWAKSVGLPARVQIALSFDLLRQENSLADLIVELEETTDPDDVIALLMAEDYGPDLANPIAERLDLGLPVSNAALSILNRIQMSLDRLGLPMKEGFRPSPARQQGKLPNLLRARLGTRT